MSIATKTQCLLPLPVFFSFRHAVVRSKLFVVTLLRKILHTYNLDQTDGFLSSAVTKLCYKQLTARPGILLGSYFMARLLNPRVTDSVTLQPWAQTGH